MVDARQNEQQALFDEISTAYGLGEGSLDLINVSENATYHVRSGDGVSTILRAYRPGHRSVDEVQSELDWMQALSADPEISVPDIIGTKRGARILSLSPDQHYVMFAKVPGSAPSEDDIVPWFARLGEICARIHSHGLSWRPQRFVRPTYDLAGVVGDDAVWGPWQKLPLLDQASVSLIERVIASLTMRLNILGAQPGAIGLIHGDLRLANLLVDDQRLHVIDFDDCGTGWLLYDLATALSMIEDVPDAPAAANAWLDRYDAVRPIPARQRGFVADLIMLRRIQVLSWFASHSETELAQEMAKSVTHATIQAAAEFENGKSPYRQ